MNIQTLITEIKDDPLNIGYQSEYSQYTVSVSGQNITVDSIVNDSGVPLYNSSDIVHNKGDYIMSTEEITTSLNTKNRTRTRLLTSRELLAWSSIGAVDASGIKSRYERFEDGAANHASPTIRGICKAAVKLIERDTTELDLNLPDRQAMVTGLVSGGILTSNEEQELYDLGAESISRGQEIGVGHVKHGHVIMARQAVEGQ